MTGPAAAPGNYQVELKVGDQTLTEIFEIQKDPRVQLHKKTWTLNLNCFSE